MAFTSTSLYAQVADGDLESGADDYGNTHLNATGTDLFALPIPGEIYSPLSGEIGHRSTDLTVRGNGPLSIAITRESEETPQAYPYALGTMSLNNPRLTITIGVTSSEYNSLTPRALNCSTWNKSVWGGGIVFEHPGGMVRLVSRTHLQNNLLDDFPSEALFISPNNWFVRCDAGDATKFSIHSPDGTRFTTGPIEWFPTPVENYKIAHTLFVDTIEKAGSKITYEYELDPQPMSLIRAPLAAPGSDENGLRNKQRLKSIKLKDSSSAPRTVNLTYRSAGTATCPNLLDRVGSSSAPGGEVRYEYESRSLSLSFGRSINQCELKRVLFVDGSQWEFEYNSSFTASYSTHPYDPNETADDVLEKKTLYLPIKNVTTPTGAKVTYAYQISAGCTYKSYLPENCKTRRPAVNSRTVADATGNSIQSLTHTIEYEIPADPNPENIARRRIINPERTHLLVFNRIDRVSHPKSTVASEVSARANSGKIKSHYVFATGATTPISGVEYEYEERRNFLDGNKIPTSSSVTRKSWQWSYEVTRDNLIKSTTHFDNKLFQTERRDFDVYNLPAFIDEHNIDTGEKRTTWQRYDNDYASKNRWVIGLVDHKATGTANGTTYNEADKAVIANTYDTDGQMASERSYGFTTGFSHGTYGELSSVTDGLGHVTTYTSYLNGVARQVSATPGTHVQSDVYSHNGLVFRITDETGVRVDYRYDNRGRMNQIYNANDLGNRVRTTHAVWHDSSNARYRNKKEWNTSGWSRYTYYDALGRISRIVERDTTHGTNDVWHKYAYDALGRLERSSYPSATDLGSGSWPGVTNTYDAVDRLLSQIQDGSAGQISYCYGTDCNTNGFGTNNRVQFGYAVKDQEGYVTVYNFRALGDTRTREVSEIYQQIDNSNNWIGTWIERNIHGFITEVAQGQYKTSALVRTYTPYSNPGTLTMLPGSETHSEFGTRTVTGYDAAGNMTRVQNFSGNTLTYGYNNRNQISSVSSSDGSYSVNYGYLDNGFLQSLSTPDTTWNYAYVPGRALLDSETLTVDGENLALSYGYDAVENLSTLTYPNGITATYDYNGFGQPTSLAVDSGYGTNGMASAATYFPNGQLGSLNLSNGLTFSSTQNASTLPEQLKVTKVGAIAPPLDVEYIYDDRQNVKRIKNYFYPYNGGIVATYDGLNRLKTATGSSWGSGGVQYDYDRVGNIERAEIDGYVLDYSYPGTSNRLGNVASSNPLKARSYTGITYDANGNITSTDGTDTMSYDEMNQMLVSSRSTVIDGTVNVTNRYDGQGYRVKTTLAKSNRTKSTVSVYNQAGNLLYEWDAESGEQRSHLFFNGKSIATLGTNATADTDNDGVPDYFERLHGMDPYLSADATEDADGDGLSNWNEFMVGSLVMSADSDNDGLSDEYEYVILDDDSGIYPPGSNIHYLVPVIHDSFY